MILLPVISFAGGKVIGNGGDSRALEFSKSAADAIVEIKSKPLLYPEVKDIDLQKVLDNSEILVSEIPVYAMKGDVRQFSTAINYHDPDTIVVYGPRWSGVKNIYIRRALALHEVLGLAGLEGTGDYSISKRYLKESGITCSLGLCEDLPRYVCSLIKLDERNIESIVARGSIGNNGTNNEIVDIESAEMKATIVMNAAATVQGHIMVILYQDGRKVGLTELRGAAFPPMILLQWKNPTIRNTWSVNCTQN